MREILTLLLKSYTKHYVITYQGEICSVNKFYSTPHWAVRSNLKNKYKKVFLELIKKAKVGKCDEVSLVVYANTRLDIDNHVQNKFLLDCLKKEYIVDDSTKYFKSVHTMHDPMLPKNTIEYNILGK